MSYSQNSKIEALDYNTIIGSDPSSTADKLNTVWAVGNGNKGYGQTALTSVTAGDLVTATKWANVTSATSAMATHQGTTITSVPAITTGKLVTYESAIPTNIATVYANRLNTAGQYVPAGTTTTSSAWLNQLTFTHTVTFESGDKARYFFNAGGQLAITFSHGAGAGINTLFNALAGACGSIVLSAPSSGSVNIGGISYNGITKVGGSGSTTSLSTNTGYYGLTTTDTLIFKQLATGSPAGYIGSFISVSARTNSPSGSNGDNGTTITFTTVWDEIPNGLLASASSTTVTPRYPKDTTNGGTLTKSWGTVTVNGSVTGS